MRLLWFAVSLAAATCRRVEEPPPAPSPEVTAAPSAPKVAVSAAPSGAPRADGTTRLELVGSTPPGATASAAPSASSSGDGPDAGRCIDPLEKEPPPVADVASICPHDPEENPPTLRRGKIKVPEAKAPTLDVEIADTPATEQRGLMYRTKLGANSGMIFVWPKEGKRVFWMHNTCLPLDMLFVAKDGTIVGIREQVPVLNDSPRQVSCPAAYVLEVNAGWSRKHGVLPGMKLDLKL